MPIGPIIRSMNHNRTRITLIVLEIAITLAIVTNCVNMILSERQKMQQKSGVDDDNIVWIYGTPFAAEFKDQSYVENVVNADLRAMQAIPGVRAAAATSYLPWAGGGSSAPFQAEGRGDKVQAQLYPARGQLIETMGSRIAEGREFRPNDTPAKFNESTKVAIISRGLAKKMWGDQKPLGHVLTVGPSSRTVIGVIDDFYNPYSWNIGNYVVFTPGRAYDQSGSAYLVRVQPGAMKSVAAQLEPRLLAVNSGRIFKVQTIAEFKRQFFAANMLVVKAMTAVIAVLVFITALGIVGITSLSVAERTKQIGTRRALGATKLDILRHFLLENWLLTTAGLLLGIIAAYGLNLFLVTHVSGVKMDWSLIAIGMVALWINGLAATMLPALRGASVSPAIATRSV
jgi:putative ABC transport system permease protein